MRLGAHLRFLALGLLLAFAALPAAPASAQQVNPTANAVKEQQFLDALKGNPSAELQGRITIPDGKAATLERPAGREWRAFHQGTMVRIGAIAVIGMLLLLTSVVGALASFQLSRPAVRGPAHASRPSRGASAAVMMSGGKIVVTDGTDSFFSSRTIFQMLHDFGDFASITASR